MPSAFLVKQVMELRCTPCQEPAFYYSYSHEQSRFNVGGHHDAASYQESRQDKSLVNMAALLSTPNRHKGILAKCKENNKGISD